MYQNNEPVLVTIGMPVYNGERFLAQALESLLSQDYHRFELLISDNGSTDRTAEICRDCTGRDSRVRYFRNDENLGAVRNFNRLVELSSGEFFMWAGDHDLWDSSFIRSCVDVMLGDPEVVLCYARTMIIGLNDEPLGLSPTEFDSSNLHDPAERYRKAIGELKLCEMVYGLIRSSALRRTGLFVPVLSPDNLLLAELSLMGRFVQIPKVLFYSRQNRPDETPEEAAMRQISILRPQSKFLLAQVIVQYLVLILRHLMLVAKAPIRRARKIGLMIDTVCCFVRRVRPVERVVRVLARRTPPTVR